MSEIPNAKVARSRLGVAIRFNPDDASAITRARQTLNSAKLKDAALRCLLEDPRPNDEQLDHIIGILRNAQSACSAPYTAARASE